MTPNVLRDLILAGKLKSELDESFPGWDLPTVKQPLGVPTMNHTAQSFARALNDLADKALMATDTLEGTRRVEDARTYADKMVTSGLATYAEGLQLFKTRMGMN